LLLALTALFCKLDWLIFDSLGYNVSELLYTAVKAVVKCERCKSKALLFLIVNIAGGE